MDPRDDEEFRDWMSASRRLCFGRVSDRCFSTGRDYESARTTVGGVVPDRTSREQHRCTVDEAEAPIPGGVGPLPDLGDDAGDGYAAASGHFLGVLSAYVEQWGPDPRADDAFAFNRAVIDARDALYVRPRPL